jgi:UDP-2,4-diacetamido-2,4,6-trideoxy-beta-L-altropyranose hydrolase
MYSQDLDATFLESMKPGVLLLRADASFAIGTGHVMRCMALGQAWHDAGGQAIFVMAEATPAVEERLRGEGFEVERPVVPVGSAADAEEISQLADEQSASWVVVDGYEFGAEYQASLKRRGLKVLFIDDNGHARHYSADLVLNQNAHASEELYPSRDSSTRLLLGPRFAMLRREFKSWRGWERKIPAAARRALVTMGGSDPDNVTQLVAQAILSADGFDATIVAGGSNPHLARLRALADSNPLRLVENTSSMPELIASADVAVAAAGTTSWEMCFLGLPALLLVLADNQLGVADKLNEQGIMVNLGRAHEVAQSFIATELRKLADSPVRRREMSERGRALVDGRGAERVVSALKRESLCIRLVAQEDCKLLWEWANDPVARASAFSAETISWDDHSVWFRQKLSDRNCRIFVALDASGLPAGQVRIERTVSQADIDISIDGRFRGVGYASRLIELASDRAFAEWDLGQLNAFVKPENVASAKAFERAGFRVVATVTVKGQPAIHYMRTAK